MRQPLATWRDAYTSMKPYLYPTHKRNVNEITLIEHIGGEVNRYEEATYYQPADDEFEPDEFLIVRPIMKCAGRGLALKGR